MNPSFPLQALLELREQEREEAARAVAAVQRRCDKIAAASESRGSDREQIECRRQRAKSVSSTQIREMQRRDDYVRALEVEIAHCDEDIRALGAELELARTELRELQTQLAGAQAALEVVILQQDNWRAAFKKRRMQREEAAAEEVALRRWRDAE